MPRNVRDTSIDAYRSLPLGEMQQTVFNAVVEMNSKGLIPATDLEISRHLAIYDTNNIRPRRFELVRRGLLEEDEKRPCSISGKKALTWKLTSLALLKISEEL